MKFSEKEGHPNIQPSTRPGMELGTSGLGGRDLNHCANSSADLFTLKLNNLALLFSIVIYNIVFVIMR